MSRQLIAAAVFILLALLPHATVSDAVSEDDDDDDAKGSYRWFILYSLPCIERFIYCNNK